MQGALKSNLNQADEALLLQTVILEFVEFYALVYAQNILIFIKKKTIKTAFIYKNVFIHLFTKIIF